MTLIEAGFIEARDISVTTTILAQQVTIQGGGAGRRVLKELRLDWRPLEDAFDPDGPDVFRLLRWEYRLVETLWGREQEVDAILEWAEHPSLEPRAALITGEGGAGKSRLAATVAAKLKGQGWSAGFLRGDEDLIDYRPSGKGLFLVLDYPEEQRERTEALLEEIATLDDASYPVRLVLLSRRPFAEWDLWSEKLKGRFGRRALAAPKPLAIETATGLIREAASRLAAQSHKPLPKLDGAEAWLKASDRHRLPLYVQAAAIHAVLEPRQAFGLAGGDLLWALARRENRRAAEISKAIGLGGTGLPRLLALSVLGDGLGPAAIQKLAAAGACPEAAGADILTALATTPYWRVGRLEALQPDALAAAFLADALFRSFPEGRPEYPDWFFMALKERADSFGPRLARLQYDLAISTGGSAGDGASISRVGHALDQCLEEMIATEPRRARVFAKLAQDLHPAWSAGLASTVAKALLREIDDPVSRSAILNNLSIYLGRIGRREEALAAAEKAVKLDRALAGDRPEAFLPGLAASLNNLASHLSGLGRREEALAVAEEAVRHYRALAGDRPEAFLPGLALSLANLSSHLSDLGRREEALAVAEEAVGHHRASAGDRPEAFVPELARSLNNLANRLSGLGRREDALAAAEEAVRHYYALAVDRPEAFVPDLALSLNTLAGNLSDLGRWEEALAAIEETVRHYRALSVDHPEAFLPGLAGSLNNLANHLSDLGRREEALAAAEEAVGHHRALAIDRPEAFVPDLAGALNTLAGNLSDLGRREEALAVAEEAVRHYRALAGDRPEAFVPELARSLANLSSHLSDLGRREEALAVAEEAVGHHRASAGDHPEAFVPELARSLANLANRLSGLGRREDALAAAEEAVRHYRALAIDHPEVFVPDLAGALNTLANRLSGLGRREDALAAAEEAVRHYRALSVDRPEAFVPDLAGALNNLAIHLSGLGRPEEALAAAEEAVRHYRALAVGRPEAFVPGLALSLNTLANHLSALGRREEALAAAEEAVWLRRGLFRDQPEAFAVDLAGSCGTLGQALNVSSRSAEAARSFLDGATVLMPVFRQYQLALEGLLRSLLGDFVSAARDAGRTDADIRQALAEIGVKLGDMPPTDADDGPVPGRQSLRVTPPASGALRSGFPRSGRR